jgi:hypothetical protein
VQRHEAGYIVSATGIAVNSSLLWYSNIVCESFDKYKRQRQLSHSPWTPPTNTKNVGDNLDQKKPADTEDL